MAKASSPVIMDGLESRYSEATQAAVRLYYDKVNGRAEPILESPRQMTTIDYPEIMESKVEDSENALSCPEEQEIYPMIVSSSEIWNCVAEPFQTAAGKANSVANAESSITTSLPSAGVSIANPLGKDLEGLGIALQISHTSAQPQPPLVPSAAPPPPAEYISKEDFTAQPSHGLCHYLPEISQEMDHPPPILDNSSNHSIPECDYPTHAMIPFGVSPSGVPSNRECLSDTGFTLIPGTTSGLYSKKPAAPCEETLYSYVPPSSPYDAINDLYVTDPDTTYPALAGVCSGQPQDQDPELWPPEESIMNNPDIEDVTNRCQVLRGDAVPFSPLPRPNCDHSETSQFLRDYQVGAQEQIRNHELYKSVYERDANMCLGPFVSEEFHEFNEISPWVPTLPGFRYTSCTCCGRHTFIGEDTLWETLDEHCRYNISFSMLSARFERLHERLRELVRQWNDITQERKGNSSVKRAEKERYREELENQNLGLRNHLPSPIEGSLEGYIYQCRDSHDSDEALGAWVYAELPSNAHLNGNKQCPITREDDKINPDAEEVPNCGATEERKETIRSRFSIEEAVSYNEYRAKFLEKFPTRLLNGISCCRQTFPLAEDLQEHYDEFHKHENLPEHSRARGVILVQISQSLGGQGLIKAKGTAEISVERVKGEATTKTAVKNEENSAGKRPIPTYPIQTPLGMEFFRYDDSASFWGATSSPPKASEIKSGLIPVLEAPVETEIPHGDEVLDLESGEDPVSSGQRMSELDLRTDELIDDPDYGEWVTITDTSRVRGDIKVIGDYFTLKPQRSVDGGESEYAETTRERQGSKESRDSAVDRKERNKLEERGSMNSLADLDDGAEEEGMGSREALEHWVDVVKLEME
ncbi:hypothetical protein M430DRAFT_193615 [Amorphotheca resinae ATCC 22711]|uniref:Uncharacterized protein n=1 Tax=Amorphotheca resinae ATCC 22711 TaxID=857342 RepID=A0A2T3AQ73_AMORE|nr:hypothetical protein M430DRAFT_193615 [Amorphotheca resinae ATCC 22711]PSS07152.1 hypothetical protein M430DRAFT_193615 [Amorphotheca resinae ATCC 22711]